ncbi:MAG: tRNA uridine-5-carboxymethylaminomethyl(34) synthesis enzyme MnmG, partial [Pseudomonadota bacterium]|nr:tRNA uridine-5-carboxymethylaminomethyl(34) synthesis enzyme MnmG [Pseudomonadota bacterium]
LITRGVAEPYRMFTSRAEYRLSLREDNADARLTEIGRSLGCVDDKRWEAFSRKRDAVALELERLKSTWVNPRLLEEQAMVRVFGKVLEREYTLTDLLGRPEVTYSTLVSLTGSDGALLSETPRPPSDVADQVELQVKYAGYISRQKDEVARLAGHETTCIPAAFDYAVVRGLSCEVAQKLLAQRPETIGQASRISGVTPAAISLLLVHLKRLNKSSGERRLAA